MPAETATFDIVKKDATVDDTLRTIVNAINQCSKSPFVQQVVQECGGANPADKLSFLRSLFSFICRNLTYKLDIPGVEEVWTPELTMREGIYDCKKGTVFIGSVLKAAGFDPIPKHVYYAAPNGGLEDYTHIYIIVPASSMHGPGAHTMEFRLYPYITMDTTNDCKFNTEVAHKKGTLYFLNGTKMELHMMGNNNRQSQRQSSPSILNTSAFSSSLNDCATKLDNDMRMICNMPSSSICGPVDNTPALIGLNNGYFNYTLSEKAGHIAKVIPLSIPRNAFLGLLYLGKLLANTPFKLNIAKRIALAWQKDKSAVRKMWWKLGGAADANALKVAVIKGSGISISGPYGNIVVGEEAIAYDYPMDAVTIWKREMMPMLAAGGAIGYIAGPELAAMIAAATPIWIQIVQKLKEMGVLGQNEQDPPVPPETPPPADPPPPPPNTPPAPGPNAQGSAGILFVSLIAQQFPVWISVPVIAIVIYNYRKNFSQLINFFRG